MLNNVWCCETACATYKCKFYELKQQFWFNVQSPSGNTLFQFFTDIYMSSIQATEIFLLSMKTDYSIVAIFYSFLWVFYSAGLHAEFSAK